MISVIYEEKNQIKPNKLELKISLTHKNQRNKPTNQISRLLKDIRRDVMGPNVYLLRLLLDRTCVKSLPLLVFYILSLFSLFSPCRDTYTHVKSIYLFVVSSFSSLSLVIYIRTIFSYAVFKFKFNLI